MMTSSRSDQGALMAADVFISFSSADREFAERIYDRLKKNGVQPWMSTRDITPGMDYQGSIVRAIQSSKVVLLVFSSKAAHSAEVVKELSLASSKLVIPARIEDVMPEGAFLYQMSNRQFYDLFDDFDRRLDDLCAYVKATVASDTLTPPPMTVKTGAPRRARTKASLVPWVMTAVFGLLALGALGWIKFGPQKAAAPEPTPVSTAPPPTPSVEAPASASVPATSTVVTVAGEAPEPMATEPSESVRTYAAMLAPRGYDRRVSVSNSIDQMPTGLSAADAAFILQNTDSSRTEVLDMIAPKLAGQLSGPAAAQVLGPLNGFDRRVAISYLVENSKLASDLSPGDAVAILENSGNSRVEAMQKIVPQLRPLDAQGLTAVLGGLNGYDRKVALKSLSDGGKIARGISQAEVPSILGDIGSSQSDALGILSPYLK